MACPICTKTYGETERSLEVCEKHEQWFVTVCSACGQAKFSDCRGICPDCMPDSVIDLREMKDENNKVRRV